MRRLVTRGRLRACGVALAGIALMGLIALTALQPVAQNGRLRVDSFALARDLGSASAAVAASSSSVASAASASSSTAASTPGATAPSTFRAAPTVPTPLPVLIVRIPPTAPPTPKPAPVARVSAPAPAPAGTSSSGGDVEAIITAAAQAAGVAPSWLISTAECEVRAQPQRVQRCGTVRGALPVPPLDLPSPRGHEHLGPGPAGPDRRHDVRERRIGRVARLLALAPGLRTLLPSAEVSDPPRRGTTCKVSATSGVGRGLDVCTSILRAGERGSV